MVFNVFCLDAGVTIEFRLLFHMIVIISFVTDFFRAIDFMILDNTTSLPLNKAVKSLAYMPLKNYSWLIQFSIQFFFVLSIEVRSSGCQWRADVPLIDNPHFNQFLLSAVPVTQRTNAKSASPFACRPLLVFLHLLFFCWRQITNNVGLFKL